eukprot:m.151691 g.151691  ORF g.151691 m.151691 type:complete len:894 (+) comp15042_c0_seq2:206-2887(+)
MPIVKDYRRYLPSDVYGVISSGAGVAWIEDDVCAAVLGGAVLYHPRTGDIKEVFGNIAGPEKVSALAVSPKYDTLAMGMQGGSIVLWSLTQKAEIVALSGHRSEVNVLRYIEDGTELLSGSNDGDIVLWDVISESGVVRLTGHSGPITDLVYLRQNRLILSGSKDQLVKVWDIEGQHCIQTIVGHRAEVHSLAVNEESTRLYVGSATSHIAAWAIADASDEMAQDEHAQKAEGVPVAFIPLGDISRSARGNAKSLNISPDGSMMICQSTDKGCDVYTLRSEEDIKKRLLRRTKRLREKKIKNNESDDIEEVKQKLDDEICSVGVLRFSSKIRAISFCTTSTTKGTSRIAGVLANNTLETHTVQVVNKRELQSDKILSLHLEGHRTPIRSICISKEDNLILTTSNSGAKVWDCEKRKCIRSLEALNSVCGLFVPGNRHAIVGTTTGALFVFDVSSGVLLEEIEAHTATVWSLDLTPDNNGFMSGSADKTVKFWEFEIAKGDGTHVSCSNVKTLKMSDDVMCVKYSPDQRLIAISLIDTTVKVFFADTLKFFLSLYGHKLPVTCMDISSDSTLIATGSADKNVKIWGLDFGDCHKSFFAHQDAVTSVKFCGKTHYLFSTGKDKLVKQWDCDVFQQIVTLEGHLAEVSGAAITSNGAKLITISQDRSIRYWERSDEILNLEEEREIEREAQYNKDQMEREAMEARAKSKKNQEQDADLPGRRTVETLKAADLLVESIELAEIEETKGPDDAPNPILLAYGGISATAYVLRCLNKITSSELEESLLVLPFAYVVKLFKFLENWIKTGESVERCTRCLHLLLRIHMKQLVTNEVMLSVLDTLRTELPQQLAKIKDVVGVNLAGLRFLQMEAHTQGIETFEEAEQRATTVLAKKRKLIK